MTTRFRVLFLMLACVHSVALLADVAISQGTRLFIFSDILDVRIDSDGFVTDGSAGVEFNLEFVPQALAFGPDGLFAADREGVWKLSTETKEQRLLHRFKSQEVDAVLDMTWDHRAGLLYMGTHPFCPLSPCAPPEIVQFHVLDALGNHVATLPNTDSRAHTEPLAAVAYDGSSLVGVSAIASQIVAINLENDDRGLGIFRAPTPSVHTCCAMFDEDGFLWVLKGAERRGEDRFGRRLTRFDLVDFQQVDPSPLNVWFDPNTVITMTTVLDDERCSVDGPVLCLDDGRFRVRARWTTPDGQTGDARTVPGQRNPNSGLLSFFSTDNWELLVKVLDGCPINGHYWFFSAGATNVGYEIELTDSSTETTRVYSNPVGKTAVTIADTNAFDCLRSMDTAATTNSALGRHR